MEFQKIEYTKCCHRLYGLLEQSTILDLVGEPWFKADEFGIRIFSRTTSRELVSIEIFERLENLSYTPQLQKPEFAPLREEIKLLRARPSFGSLSNEKMDFEICRCLSDFLRVHYKKFN